MFSLGPLRNPAEIIVTDSFELTSFVSDGESDYMIDGRITDLEVNFKCLFPCAACAKGRNDVCEKCFVEKKDAPKILHKGSCLSECPLFSVAVGGGSEREQSCSPCFDTSCEKCSGPSQIDQCERCAPKWILYDGGCLT